ncbi:hypothetical protein GCM10010389_31240 [Streptomyces echinoruber]|uniref:Uncharacterized protein n=1 Tax=Streptomyces echinoruber TaxID=68898 RepID=A0A918R9I6_9ACTN|nr:hypothetical protein GCM10010389_31240 [Streptomyces echinoruber]
MKGAVLGRAVKRAKGGAARGEGDRDGVGGGTGEDRRTGSGEEEGDGADGSADGSAGGRRFRGVVQGAAQTRGHACACPVIRKNVPSVLWCGTPAVRRSRHQPVACPSQ